MGKFFLGFYICGMLFTFVVTCFFVALSGDLRELWRIPVYTIGWPVVFVRMAWQIFTSIFC